MARIGVLAVQGGFAAHQAALRALGHETIEIRNPSHVGSLDGLVLPGGESSTQLSLIESAKLAAPLSDLVRARKPVLATCAGLILAASDVARPAQPSLGWLDVSVERNAYGRQLQSREAKSAGGLPLVMIRAPRIVRCGPKVTVVDRYLGDPVLVRQGNIVGATFHPELAQNETVHRDVFGAL